MDDRRDGWFRRHHTHIRLGIRIAAGGILAYLLCHLLGLTQSYPAVLTAVIVMQSSVGASLKAMLDRFIGSLGGAVWGVAVLIAVHQFNNLTTGMALMLALAPLALLAAFKPAYRAAPTTAIILLLTANGAAGPLAPAIQRMLGIGLGSVIALVASLFVLPERAHGAFAESAGRAVMRMSELTSILMKGLTGPADAEAIHRFHDEIRIAINRAEAVADEVARERASFLTAGIDPQPLCRTLRRLRNDLVTIGRTTAEQLPEPLRSRMAGPSTETASAISGFLRAGGEAIARQQSSPSIASCEDAFVRYAAAMADLRKAGLMRELKDDAIGRVYGLSFALEQLHWNLLELVDRINELAR